MYCKHLSMPRKAGCHDDEILSRCHNASESFDEWPAKIYCLYQLWSVWIFCPNYVIYSRAKWTACCCTMFLSFCGQQWKKKMKLWAINLYCFIYSDNGHIYKLCIMTWLEQEEKKCARSVLSLSSIGCIFTALTSWTKKYCFLPLNSIIVLFSASTLALPESVIFISSQRCHTVKSIFNNQMCITVTFNSKSKYVLCSRVNNLQCI